MVDNPEEVQVSKLVLSDFGQEIISNGKIKAKNIVALKFVNQEIITRIFVHNGMHVVKGQKIAELDTYTLEKNVEQSYNLLGQANLEYQNMLIGQGYKLNDINKAPEDLKKLARLKSGLNSAQIRYDMSKSELQHALLTSPIEGEVANLFLNVNSLSAPNETFCNIIDSKELEVLFPLLETELANVRVGDDFNVTPFSNSSISAKGKIIEINPLIDENGVVKIKGRVRYNSQLIEGMNVHVVISRWLKKQMVVPKQAVVQRTGRQVVFSLVQGKARWNYITTEFENSNEFSISSETLKEGDTIIITGNQTLAHNSKVRIVQ
ncbi:efflux RND transporter periplasmic adaptor subunit [Pedobacter foliorum]|uniref:efflux RND transporter periplasmic adaptor subunit n=1 Tax=Pedobacter foliorum TaxID=2739058 RepID=UPI001565F769|nr:efflux RND transporter periplasmic adaptor subunit [Pedobacter foliorum]NRF38553.1 efflux RND transporter periplasmic adaptor subunit [Pedobacter foliorum]